MAVMLAVICLSVILSLEADAHPVTPWSAATLEVRIVPSNQQQSEEGNWQSNGTCSLQDVLSTIASNQQQNAEEIRELKRLLVSGSVETNETRLETIVKEIKNELQVVKSLLSNCEHVTAEPTINPTQSTTADCTPLLIQQHVNNGSDFFNRSWAEFKVGFGDPSGNYWLGNDQLSQLTANNSYKLRFDLQARRNSKWYWAEYSTFRVLTEADNYKQKVAGFDGNAHIDEFSYHNGMMFSTYDRDNDLAEWGNCAVRLGGGFWYNDCALCSVNGNIFVWDGLPGVGYLQTSRMWLACK